MKRNKFFLASAAITALTLTACTDKDEFSQADLQKAADEAVEGQIQFGTYMGKNGVTRAATTVDQSYIKGTIGNDDAAKRGITNLRRARFGVFAYFTGATDYDPASTGTWRTSSGDKSYPNFMYNQQLIYGNDAGTNAWVYDPVKYWPNGIDKDNQNGPSNTALQKGEGKLSFYAFAPYTATNLTVVSDKKPTGVAAKQTDKTDGVVAVSTNESPTNVWVKYKMADARTTEAVDLLWGLAGKENYNETDGTDAGRIVGKDYNINLTKQIVAEKVKFLFKHALAKVGGATTVDETETTTGEPAQCGFYVVADVDKNSSTPKVTGESNQTDYFGADFTNTKTLITLKEVKIQDGKSASDDTAVPVSDLSSNFNNYGWFNIETGAWCDESGTYGIDGSGATYNITANSDADLTNGIYKLNDKILEIGAGKYDASGTLKKLKDVDGKEWSTANPVGVTLTPTKLFANENVPGLLVIPGGTGNELYVTVDYFVRTADPSLAKGFSEVEQIITNKVSLGSLDPNKYYSIVMHLGLTSVKFEAVVTDWASTSDATFNSETGAVVEGLDENREVVWLPSNIVTANNFDFVVTPSATSVKAMGEDITLTSVTVNSTDVSSYINVTSPADWLTWNTSTNKLTAAANTNKEQRQAIVTVKTTSGAAVEGLSTTFVVTQAGFKLALTASDNIVTVKDGDNQNVTTGYTVVVSGGDGNGAGTNTAETITVTGTAGQTYTVTVTHDSGATATTTVTIPAP